MTGSKINTLTEAKEYIKFYNDGWDAFLTFKMLKDAPGELTPMQLRAWVDGWVDADNHEFDAS